MVFVFQISLSHRLVYPPFVHVGETRGMIPLLNKFLIGASLSELHIDMLNVRNPSILHGTYVTRVPLYIMHASARYIYRKSARTYLATKEGCMR